MCVCVLTTLACCAKTVEPIEMLFGVWVVGAENTIYYVGARIPHVKGHLYWGNTWT